MFFLFQKWFLFLVIVQKIKIIFWVVDYYLIISITLCIYFVCSSAKYK